MCKDNTERKESPNKETLLCCSANSWGKDSNRVEAERQIPKLKLLKNYFILMWHLPQKRNEGQYKEVSIFFNILQEFQYGKETVQTTTNDRLCEH